MSFFESAGDFFGGISDEIGLTSLTEKSASDIGGDLGGGLVDLFKFGITNELDELYGVPTGDPHQVVTKRNSRTPATVAGQTAPVQTSNLNGASPVSINGIVSNPQALIVIGLAIVLLVVVKR